MSDLFTTDFTISKLNLCVLVKAGSGRNIHRNRPNHGLVYYIDGIRRYSFDSGEEITISGGDLLYLPRFSSYYVTTLKPGDCVAINFELSDSRITYPPASVHAANPDVFLRDFREAVRVWQQGSPGSLNRCFGLLYTLLYEFQQQLVRNYISPKNKALAQTAADHIAEHLSDPALSVEGLSQMLDISPEYFRKLFKDTFQISPRKFIIQRRMALAKALLSSGEFSVAQAGEMCGFENMEYFSRAFKKYTGLSPRSYIRQYHSG